MDDAAKASTAAAAVGPPPPPMSKAEMKYIWSQLRSGVKRADVKCGEPPAAAESTAKGDAQEKGEDVN